MIKEATYYEMYCDRCGKQLDDGDIVAYKEKEGLEFVAGESEWQTIEGKHYCPDCYELDEVTDKYKPKKGGKQWSKTTYCGECEKFLYEDVCGFGICKQNDGVCHCGDKCHITNGKP